MTTPPRTLSPDVLAGRYRCDACCLLDSRSPRHAFWHRFATGQELAS